jgi:hypothetical protein
MSQLVKTKRQANFKDFKRFGGFKVLVEQKNVVFNSFVCKLGSLCHSSVFKTHASLAGKYLLRKLGVFNHLGYAYASPRQFKNTSHLKVNFRSL